MPRASWNGFLRLSLVTCPVALVPATTEAKRIRLNQLNAATGNRVAQQLVDAKTGETLDRDQIVKGFEYDRGRYVTLSDEELKEIQIESSKIIDLDQFAQRILIAVAEVHRLEGTGAPLDDRLGDRHHVGIGFALQLAAKFGRADLVAGAQGRHDKAAVARLDENRPLAARNRDPAEPDLVLVRHRLADDAKRLGRQFAVGIDVVGRVEVERIDGVAVDELVEVDDL